MIKFKEKLGVFGERETNFPVKCGVVEIVEDGNLTPLSQDAPNDPPHGLI